MCWGFWMQVVESISLIAFVGEGGALASITVSLYIDQGSQRIRSFTRCGRALNTSPSTNPPVSSASLTHAASPFAYQMCT